MAAALLASPDADRWPDFYAAFGTRRHVDGLRDDAANLALTVDELGLPPRLLEAAEDPSWDPDLRRRTATAIEPLKGEGGTPVLHLAGRGFFGPVLTAVPHAAEAVRLWEAVATLASTPGFSEIKGARDDELRTS